MAYSSNERFGANSTEPTVGVVRGAEVAMSSGSVGVESMVWHSPDLSFPGVETGEDGSVISVNGVEIEPFTGNDSDQRLG